MSRATVRSMLTAYLTTPPISGLNAVLSTQPKDLGDHSFLSGAPGESSGAIGVVFVERQQEQARAVDGAGGGRMTTYRVGFQIFHRSVEPKAEAAMAHFDSVVDAVLNRLRADPSLGLGIGVANANGLISAAYEELDVEFGEPELGTESGGWIDTWCVVRFPALEWNQVT